MNRRKFMAGLMAGGVVIAGKLWIPGQKLISIPKGKTFTGIDFANEYGDESLFTLIDRNTVRYVGHEDKVASMPEFMHWIKKNAAHMLRSHSTETIVTLGDGYRMENAWHLTEGSLRQDAPRGHGVIQLKETWSCDGGMDAEELCSDKIFHSEYGTPRERISLSDSGHRGYK